MKNYKGKKGITLVALIITIIILLILAGIAISQLTDSGLFEKSKIAKESAKNAQDLENSILGDYENQIAALGDRGTVTISEDEYNILKNGNSYSETEKVIGTWVDGKKLYQRSLKFTGTSNVQIYASDEATGKSVPGVTTTYLSDIAPTLATLVSATLENNQGFEYPFRFKCDTGYIACCDNPNVAYYGLTIHTGSYVTLRYTKTGNQ